MGSVTIRPFQIEAVNKFRKVESVIVGDETGTGKTVTCIALVQQIWDLGESGPCLIVAKSFDVWTKHLAMMGIDSDRVHVINKDMKPPSKARDIFIRDMLDRQAENPLTCHFYILHWEALRLIEELTKVKFLVVLADEAHRAKNRKSEQSKAIKRIKTRYKIASTATPGDNFGQDIWSVLNWLYPKKYTSYWRWVREYMDYETTFKGYTIFRGMRTEKIPDFLADIDPFYISRPLSVVSDDVPEYEYYEIFVDMGELQAQAYHDIGMMQMAQVEDDEWLVASTQLTVNQRMQQLAMAYGKVEWKKKWVIRKVLEGDKFVNKRVQEEYQSVRLIRPSTKLDMFVKMVAGESFVVGENNEQLHRIPTDEPLVVFSQFRDMITMACEEMDKLGISYTMVMGGADSDVDKAAAEFQRGDVRVFIATVQTASESIELVRGRYQIYFDRHWSPRVKQQSEGRNRRLTQTRQPICYDIKTRNTVDQVRLDRVRTKEEWLDAMFGRTWKTNVAKTSN